MARQKNNMIMRNTRGMVGKQIVFKRRAGKSFVAAPPDVNENRIPTAAQLAVQNRFKKSSAYAKTAMQDPDTKSIYEAQALRGQSAFNVAFKDAFFPPEVVGIITQGYTGQVGSLLLVQATDNFKVNEVRVQIFNPANQLIEEGEATATGDGLNWNYVATALVANIAGCKVKATAFDLPENDAELEVVL